MANSTIQQHQPLRVPRNWNTQEKALIVQLDEVFDDIYRRFGRLRIEDMGDKFRKRFEDAEGAIVEFEVDISGLTTRVSNAEGNITSMTLDISGLNTRVVDAEGAIGQLEVRAGEIEVSVGNKYDKISGITINTNGIDLTGNKYIKLNSGTSIDIRTGGTFTVQSGQFSIDENGNASFAGALNAATGTFAGTLSASCITSGTMSANRISGGTIDATNVTINNLDASKITSGTMSANKISGGSIDATNVTITNLNASNITSGTMSANKISGGTIDATNVIINNLDASKITSGTMSANKISGGTLTLGGNNNTNGTILIKDANGAQIGKWDKDGLSATKGSFGGDLNAAGGTFAGTLQAAGGTFTGEVQAGEWTFNDTGIIFHNEYGYYTREVFIIPEKNQYVLESLSISLNNENLAQVTSYYLGFNNFYAKRNEAILPKPDLGTSSNPWGNGYINNVITSSSRNIKHGIQELPEDGERLDRLRPVSFIYDDDPEETRRTGLILEEAMEVMPEICVEDGIKYIELIPIILKEMQGLRARVKELERGQNNVQSN